MVRVPSGIPLGRIVCPDCGNDSEFIEVARNVIVTTRYVQNGDGSFSNEEGESEIMGKVGLYCSECECDVSRYHAHVLEMSF